MMLLAFVAVLLALVVSLTIYHTAETRRIHDKVDREITKLMGER